MATVRNALITKVHGLSNTVPVLTKWSSGEADATRYVCRDIESRCKHVIHDIMSVCKQ